MLGICLKILSILGIILLILFAIVIGGILLVLLFPFTYRVCGSKNEEGIRLTARIGWLFGLLRVNCDYPHPGRLRVKILFFKLFDCDLNFNRERNGTEPEGATSKGASHKKNAKKSKKAKEKSERKSQKKSQKKSKESSAKIINKSSETGDAKETETKFEEEKLQKAEEASGNQESQKNSSKIEKIKYTICNIYDKIKKIWKNISCYVGLLQKEETKMHLSKSLTALGKILKSIRPRRIRADIRFGTGAPDTTGYIYGIYCMLSSSWKPGLLATPDFEDATLAGEFDISGRIIIWVLLINGLKMYELIRKLTAEIKDSV